MYHWGPGPVRYETSHENSFSGGKGVGLDLKVLRGYGSTGPSEGPSFLSHRNRRRGSFLGCPLSLFGNGKGQDRGKSLGPLRIVRRKELGVLSSHTILLGRGIPVFGTHDQGRDDTLGLAQ